LRKELLTTYLKLHLIVLIYGFTAILGKLIELPALELVWYRMMIAILTFFIYLKFRKESVLVPRKVLFRLFGVGLIIALHWVTFYGAIKLSNVSVTLGCFATTTLFTSFLEPFFYRKRINVFEVLVGLIIIAGLYLIFTFETRYALGILVSLFSAFLAGLFTVLNKKLVAKHSSVQISFFEMIGGLAGLSIFITLSGRGIVVPAIVPSLSDLFYLIILATICTAFAHTTQVEVMKHLTAFTVTLAINLEPVYGIVMAFFIFGDTERMTSGFYLGTLIILLSVIGFPIIKYYLKTRKLAASRTD
jgi:drug/metabolite transporter (DMT)-like permease